MNIISVAERSDVSHDLFVKMQRPSNCLNDTIRYDTIRYDRRD